MIDKLKNLILLLSIGSSYKAYSNQLWFENTNNMKRGFKLPVQDHIEYISISPELFMERMNNTSQRKDNEVPSFYINKEDDLKALSFNIAKKDKSEELYQYLKPYLEKHKKKQVRVFMNAKLLELVDLDLLIKASFTTSHHRVEINASLLNEDSEWKESVFKELSPFLKKEDLKNVRKKWGTNTSLSLQDDLLPPFARKALKTHASYRGLNCFHAALAFQDASIPSNTLLHPLRQKNYTWQMINNDELWRVLSEGFYEVNAEQSELKYGDILVFFDKPKKASKFVDYRWIKHATVYLFGEYTFSKGSKSANSTYTINTLAEEEHKWRGLIQNLAIKIFRKSLIRVKTLPYADQHDWLY